MNTMVPERHPRLTVAAVLVLLLAAVGGAFLWLGQGSSWLERSSFWLDIGSRTDRLAGAAREADVVFVLVDALRADRLGAYGHRGHLTPRIDALAEHSLIFTDAHANAPSTVRSVASLFTSTLPLVHGVSAPPGEGDELHLSALPDEMVLAPEHFRRHGYATVMVTGRGWITPEVNYDQGVDEYVLLDDRADRNVIDAAVEVLRRRAVGRGGPARTPRSSPTPGDGPGQDRQPVFLYLHLLDLHDYYHSEVFFERHADLAARASERLQALGGASPGEIYHALYTEPESFTAEDVRLLSEAYDRELARTDEQLGRLVDALAELGLLEQTLVVLTSDHGEQFGEHGLLGHGGDGFHDEVLRIPFIVAGPGIFETGHEVEVPVSSVDLVPTVADLVGLEAVPEWQGRSALTVAGTAGGTAEDSRTVAATNRRTWKLLTPEWSYIYSERYEREELYDRRKDPGERQDLAARRPEVVDRFRHLLAETIDAAGDHPYTALHRGEVMVSEKVLETLRSLGYIR